MGASVSFDYDLWAKMFPQVAMNTNKYQIENLVLPLASQYCPIDGTSPCCIASTLSQAINLMVAHISQLFFGINGAAPSGAVGRVADASEGSVSVTLDYGATNSSSAWFVQTPWGAAYWQLMLPFRSGVQNALHPQPQFYGGPVVNLPRAVDPYAYRGY